MEETSGESDASTGCFLLNPGSGLRAADKA